MCLMLSYTERARQEIFLTARRTLSQEWHCVLPRRNSKIGIFFSNPEHKQSEALAKKG